MKINFESKTIEISKTFANKASHFGSNEYDYLRTVIRDLPDFRVEIMASTASRRTSTKGLTYEYMESYIAEADVDGSVMNEFQCLRECCNYAQVKKWFTMVFAESECFVA